MRDEACVCVRAIVSLTSAAREDGGVVDKRLNVYGCTNLKVADLSICPGNVSSNTNSTALVVGEKAAMLIAEDFGNTMGAQ